MCGFQACGIVADEHGQRVLPDKRMEQFDAVLCKLRRTIHMESVP